LTTKTCTGFLEKALKQNNFSENPDKFLNDIVTITCLILRDGEEYRFIHKSVQEFYTAAFIQKKPESWANEFYTRFQDKKNYSTVRAWDKELEFLHEIDKYRFEKYYLLPIILDYLKISEKDLQGKCPKTTLAKTKEILGHFQLDIIRDSSKLKTLSYDYLTQVVDCHANSEGALMFDFKEFFSLDYKAITKAFKSQLIKPIRISDAKEYDTIKFEVLQLLKKGLMKKEFMAIAENMLNSIFIEAVKIASSLKREEKDEILKGLI